MSEDPYTHIRANIKEEELPRPDDRKKIMRYSPKVYEAFFGRKYILPQYRAPHYYRQDFINFIEWAGIAHFPVADQNDEIIRAQFVCSAIALAHKRPQLFLEPELGEALLRTALPVDMVAEDFKWKWPGFKVFLPKGLISIERKGYKHSLMYLDIAHLDSEGLVMQTDYAREFDQYFFTELPEVPKNIMHLEGFHFHYKEAALVIAGMIDKSPDNEGLTTYGLVKPFTHYTVQELVAMDDELKSEWPRDDLDQVFMQKMEVLALNILLFLSAYPVEYQPDEKQVLRKPRLEGKHHIPGLYPAKWVGQSQIRPAAHETHHRARMIGEDEWHLKKHWRCGHWKRQVFGPKRGDRKLIWINPYQAGREEEISKNSHAN